MTGAERGAAIGSRADFVAAVRAAVDAARDGGARTMVWADADFAAWPLEDVDLLQSLTDWVRLPKRRLVLVARSFDAVQRDAPRFVAWRRLWSHAVDAFTPAAGNDDELPCLLLVGSVRSIHLFDPQRWRGRAGDDPAEVRGWADRIDAFLQRCEPAFAPTTLGL